MIPISKYLLCGVVELCPCVCVLCTIRRPLTRHLQRYQCRAMYKQRSKTFLPSINEERNDVIQDFREVLQIADEDEGSRSPLPVRSSPYGYQDGLNRRQSLLFTEERLVRSPRSQKDRRNTIYAAKDEGVKLLTKKLHRQTSRQQQKDDNATSGDMIDLSKTEHVLAILKRFYGDGSVNEGRFSADPQWPFSEDGRRLGDKFLRFSHNLRSASSETDSFSPRIRWFRPDQQDPVAQNQKTVEDRKKFGKTTRRFADVFEVGYSSPRALKPNVWSPTTSFTADENRRISRLVNSSFPYTISTGHPAKGRHFSIPSYGRAPPRDTVAKTKRERGHTV